MADPRPTDPLTLDGPVVILAGNLRLAEARARELGFGRRQDRWKYASSPEVLQGVARFRVELARDAFTHRYFVENVAMLLRAAEHTPCDVTQIEMLAP